MWLVLLGCLSTQMQNSGHAGRLAEYVGMVYWQVFDFALFASRNFRSRTICVFAGQLRGTHRADI